MQHSHGAAENEKRFQDQPWSVQHFKLLSNRFALSLWGFSAVCTEPKVNLWWSAKTALSICREKGEELRAAVEDWQTKREVPEPRLTTGFLDGIVPIVDSYELKVSFSACLQPSRSVFSLSKCLTLCMHTSQIWRYYLLPSCCPADTGFATIQSNSLMPCVHHSCLPSRL